MTVRGVRGATTIDEDNPQNILAATRELLKALLEANPDLRAEDIASCIFTVTDDLHSIYPAQAARQFGWSSVPLLCAREIAVMDGLPLCVRVLIHWNTHLTQDQVKHVYLRKAKSLRPDLQGDT
jgi:chorismate mutase